MQVHCCCCMCVCGQRCQVREHYLGQFRWHWPLSEAASQTSSGWARQCQHVPDGLYDSSSVPCLCSLGEEEEEAADTIITEVHDKSSHEPHAESTRTGDLPIGAGKKAKHTMVDKVVNTVLPPSCSLNPAASSTLMRPAESAASQSRCVIADLRQEGHIRSWVKVLSLRSVVVPVAITCQHTLYAQGQARPDNSQMACGQEQVCG